MEVHTAGKHLTIHPAATPFLAFLIDEDWGANGRELKRKMKTAAI
jgi:hypothetical protein